MLFYFLTFGNNYKYNRIYYSKIDEIRHLYISIMCNIQYEMPYYGNDMVSLVMKNTIALDVCFEIVIINKKSAFLIKHFLI